MSRTRITGIVLSCVVGCFGCESEPAATPEPSSEPSPGAAVEAPAAEQKEAAAPVIAEPTFRLALADEGEGGVVLTLEARGGYHINQDFPFEAKLASPTATLTKDSLAKADASEFGELTARFPVSAELPAGEHEITAQVRFAVCTEETCVPDRRTLALTLKR